MQTYEEAKRAAKVNLLQAELALDEHVHSSEFNFETLKRLTEAVHSARCEVLDLLSALWPDREQEAIYFSAPTDARATSSALKAGDRISEYVEMSPQV
jgi:hypothetical protein